MAKKKARKKSPSRNKKKSFWSKLAFWSSKPKKSTRKKKKKTTGKSTSQNKSSFKFLGIQFLVLLVLVAMVYIAWLDHRVRTEFEGQRWSLPARVYAKPMEIYIGATINQQEIISELNALGYQNVKSLSKPGQYQIINNGVLLYNREFSFWDEKTTSRSIRLQFTGGKIVQIVDQTDSSVVPVFRLEPQLIGKIYPEHNEDRILVPYDEVPPFLVDALIAVEDRNFFGHSGVDPKGILRAAFRNITSGRLSQGGSTLTQQLVKNYFLTHERTFRRKFNELFMALLLEYHYSKAEILSAYINEIYLGQHGARGVHGFGTAAEYYFSRPLKELRQDEIALLVAMVKGASYYNPRKHPERATKRRNLSLQLMQEQGHFSESEFKTLSSRPLRISKKPTWSSAKYPAFLDLVRRQLKNDYEAEDLRTEGLRIFTTLNTRYQDVVDKTIASRLKNLETQKQLPAGTLETASILANIETGEVLALAGGRESQNNDFNRALDAVRPIGSLVKPAVYLAALSQPEKYNSLSPLEDQAIQIKQHDGTFWEPKNYDELEHGSVALHTALSKSYNLATVNLGMALGLKNVIKTLHALGIENSIREYPSLLLGALELSPIQVTQMYQTLASGGFKAPLRAIRDVLDKDGQPLSRYGLEIKQTIDTKPVFVSKYLLTEVVSSGTARSAGARLPNLLPLAGKTGTTNDLRDSWFAGFGDDVLGVVWIGRDDNQSSKLTGSSGALQLWIDMMAAVKPKPISFPTPNGIQWLKSIEDKPVSNDCVHGTSYPFIETQRPIRLMDCDNVNIPSTNSDNDINSNIHQNIESKKEKNEHRKQESNESLIRRAFDLL